VIIYDFHIVTITVLPSKTNPPLLVDANAILTYAITAQFLQSVSRQDFQIVKLFRRVENFQFHSRLALDIRWQGTGFLALKEFFGLFIGEGLNHCLDNNVLRYHCQVSRVDSPHP
jgi:hypothetical protein